MNKEEMWDLAIKYNMLSEEKIEEMAKAYEEKKHIQRCIKEFQGNIENLSKAIGYLYIGQAMGHRF